MPSIEKRTVSLPSEQAAYVDRLVASGGYASASEVVRAGLRVLQAQDAAVEHWLREQVYLSTMPCWPILHGALMRRRSASA